MNWGLRRGTDGNASDRVTRRSLRPAAAVVLAVAGLACAAPALGSDAAITTGGQVGTFAGYGGHPCDYTCPYGGAATTTLVVPKLRCGTAEQAIAAGVGGSLAGNRESVAALFIGCDHGQAHYWPELELKGRITDYRARTAQAGDTVVLRMAYGHWRGSVSVTDVTRRFQASRTGRGGDIGDEWIGDYGWASRQGRLEGVPDFGTLTYSHSRIDGAALDTPGGFIAPQNRTSLHTLQIATGPLFSGGHAFRTRFRHS